MQYEVNMWIKDMLFESYAVVGMAAARFLAAFLENEFPGAKCKIETLKKSAWHKELRAA